jgi:hypothetical protein
MQVIMQLENVGVASILPGNAHYGLNHMNLVLNPKNEDST